MKVYKDNVGRVWYIDGTDIFDEDGAPLPTQKKIDEENTRLRTTKASKKVRVNEEVEEVLSCYVPPVAYRGPDGF